MGEDNKGVEDTIYLDGEPINKIEPVELTLELPPDYALILTPEMKEFICNLGQVIVKAWENIKKALEPYIPLIEKYTYASNNWRKRHGIPMRRRGGKRKSGRR